MKSSLIFRCAKVKEQAFTLVELLTSIAVLGLITVMLAQMLGMTSQTYLRNQARVNNFTKARALLELFARDLENGILRNDLAAFPTITAPDGTPAADIAFYTKRSGYQPGNPDVRSVSLVSYKLGSDPNDSTLLERGDLPVAWDIPTDISFGKPTLERLSALTLRDTAAGVIALKVQFIGSDGTTSAIYDPTKHPRAVAIALATVDDRTLKTLSPAQIASLRSTLESLDTTGQSVKTGWDDYLNKPTGIDWSAYPSKLGEGLKVFERYVLLP